MEVSLPTVLNGCDTRGKTAERPRNADPGQPYWDTTLDKLIVKTKTGWEVVGTGVSADPPAPDNPQPPTLEPAPVEL